MIPSLMGFLQTYKTRIQRSRRSRGRHDPLSFKNHRRIERGSISRICKTLEQSVQKWSIWKSAINRSLYYLIALIEMAPHTLKSKGVSLQSRTSWVNSLKARVLHHDHLRGRWKEKGRPLGLRRLNLTMRISMSLISQKCKERKL